MQLFGTEARLAEDKMLNQQRSYFGEIPQQQPNLNMHFFLFDHKLPEEIESSDLPCAQQTLGKKLLYINRYSKEEGLIFRIREKIPGFALLFICL